MIISRIAHVALGVPDINLAIEFYGDIFGLDVCERRGEHIYMSSGMSTAFELEFGPYAPGMDHFAFGVRGQAALDQARQRLREAGVTVVDSGAGDEPGLAAGITFALPTGHPMELVVEANPRGFVTRAEAPRQHHRGGGPAPLEHITLLASDIRANAEFLIEHLGFEITDSWQPGEDEPWKNTWLRAGELHHDLAMLVANRPEPELHHFCFAVASVADLVQVADALAARGMAVDSSLGRHIGGNNIFLYFKDPFGNRVEVNTDMARIDPAAPPRVMRQPLPFDAWREGRPPALVAGSACRDARHLAAV